jgi:hypothetical protein
MCIMLLRRVHLAGLLCRCQCSVRGWRRCSTASWWRDAVILRRRSALTSWRQSGNGLLGALGSSWRTSIFATLPGAWLTGFVLFSPLHSCGSCKIMCHLLASQRDVVKCGELFNPVVHDPRVSPAHMILRSPIGRVRYQANPVVPYQTN